MILFDAIKKLIKRKRSKSYYNSDYILSVKEKQVLLTTMFVIIFPLIVATIVVLVS